MSTDPSLGRLARLAADVFAVSAVAISRLESGTRRVLASVGAPVDSPVELGSGMLVAPDTSRDERFPPGSPARFYAAAPMGEQGWLELSDPEPRELDAAQRATLEGLAALAADHLERWERHRILEQVARNTPDVIYVYDLTRNRLVYLNRDVREILGYTAEDLLRMGDRLLGNLIHPDDFFHTLQHLSWFDGLADGAVVEISARLRHADGEWRWFRAREAVFQREPVEGKATQFVGVATDVTAYRDVQSQLEHQVQVLQTVLDSAGEGIVVADASGEMTQFNPTAERIIGVGPVSGGPPIWSSAYGVFEPDGVTPYPSERLPLARALRGEDTDDIELFVRNPSVPEGVWIRCAGRPLFSPNGDLRGAVVTFNDVSELKRAHRELVQLAQARSEFLATMSHEIRTPMNGVVGMCHLLSETELTPEQREYVDTISQCGALLLGLINDILELSKIEAGKLELERVEFHLRDELEGLLSVLAPAAQSKGLEMLYRVKPDVPNRWIGDSLRLKQVLMNLLGNAVKFTPEGEVELSVRRAPGGLAFEVRDTGPGIPAERQRELFTPYAQLDTGGQTGTGLGLAISQRLVQAMGGTIELASAPGLGTTFRFQVQLEPVPDGAIQPAGPPLLLVDPYEPSRQGLRWQIESAGVAVAEESDLERAFQTARDQPESYRAVVVRARQQRLPAALPEVPVFLLLPFPELLSAETGLRASLAGCLGVPLNRRQLIRMLDKEPERPHRAPSADGLERYRILVVEDNPVNLRLIIRLLQRRGYTRIVTATGGQEAVELASREAFDLILMDYHLPGMDGVTATRAIRQAEQTRGSRRARVVALTASVQREDEQACLEAGMDAFLTKPVIPGRLYEMLQEMLPAGL